MIYTVGHSTLSRDGFAAAFGRVRTVIDVRSHPTSRWEHFRKEELESWLPEAGIGYEWAPGLGGWASRHLHLAGEMEARRVDVRAYASGKFPKQRIGKDFPDPGQPELPLGRPSWTNQGLYDFSWFASLREFVDAAEELLERGRGEDVGIMCCEAQWWRCHRSMIADYLLHRGLDAVHLMPVFRQRNGERTVSGSKEVLHSSVAGNRLDRYDPEVVGRWPAGAP